MKLVNGLCITALVMNPIEQYDTFEIECKKNSSYDISVYDIKCTLWMS